MFVASLALPPKCSVLLRPWALANHDPGCALLVVRARSWMLALVALLRYNRGPGDGGERRGSSL